MRYHSHRRITTWIFMLCLISMTGCSLFEQDPEPTQPDPHAPYGAPPNYELPTDLAPDAVDVDDAHHFPSLTYGIHAFFWWDEMYRNHGLDTMNLMQFTHVRQSFSWSDVEPEKRDENLPSEERYFWREADLMMTDIEAKGIEVLARIDNAPAWAINGEVDYDDAPFDLARFGQYCGALATRYQGRIAAYQVWNEPNLHREWGNHPPSPNGYAQMLKVCSDAIRAADPAAIIVSAGLAPTGNRDLTAMPDEEYLWKLYEVEGFSDSFDVLGLNAPGYKVAPETDPQAVVDEGGLRWQCFRHVEHMRAIMVANGDASKQIAITEMGWTTDTRPDSPYHWFAVKPRQQADYLVRAYAYAAENWRPWVGLMVVLYLPDAQWTENDEQYWWAIGKAEPAPWLMSTRPAYAALLEMRKISTNPAYDHPARDEFGNPIHEDDDDTSTDD